MNQNAQLPTKIPLAIRLRAAIVTFLILTAFLFLSNLFLKISQSEQANDLVKRFSFIAMLLTTGGLLFALLHAAPPLIGRILVQRGQVTALFTKDVRTTKSSFTLYYATVNGLNFLIPFNFYVSIHIDDLIELVYPRPLFARFSGKYLEPFYFRQVNGKESITTSDKEI